MILAFVIGLIFGSFLNVVIYRLKTGEPLGFSRSFCPECKAKLKWHDLIPLLSFIFLRGRCRYCHKKISWQYPAVEFMSGLLWVLIFYAHKLNGNFQFSIFNFQYINIFYEIVIFSALLIIAVYDFKWQIIPDRVVYPAIAVALVYNVFNAPLDKGGLWGVLLTATAAFLFFFSIYFFSDGKAIGLGDAKLAILIGLFLNPAGALASFVLAFVIGAVFGIILVALGKKTFKSQVAFGPFMALGAFVAFFLSDFIINFLIF